MKNNRWIERSKSAALIILVITSLVLTGYLWYSAPSYEENREEDYLQPPYIGTEKENDKTSYDFTEPIQMIAHRTGQHLLVQADENEFKELYNMVRGVSLLDFEQIQPSTEDWNRFYNQSQGVEFQFINDRSIGQLDTFFQRTTLRNETTLTKIAVISRLAFFTDSKTNQVWVWFLFDDNQQVVQARVDNINSAQVNLILAKVTSAKHNLVTPIPTNEKLPWEPINKKRPFSRMLYLPIAPLQVQHYTYDYRTIDINTMKQWLFKDPYVTPIQLNNDELLYMYNGQDQNIYSDQIITFHKHQATMSYTNAPTPTDKPRMLIREELNQLNQFMQRHRGWTGRYTLDQITTDKQMNNYLFRLIVSGLPVYWNKEIAGKQANTIELSVTQNSVSKYTRSLLFLTAIPSKKENQVLPMQSQLLNSLKAKQIPLSKITRIFPGFEGVHQSNDKQFILQPVWVIKTIDGKLKKIPSVAQGR